jgi:hypothetical protein
MADETIIVLNVPAVAGALARYPQIAGIEWANASDAALYGLVNDLARYPPEPAGSSYRRTGTLGRLWGIAMPDFATIPTGFEGTLVNNTPYGEFVQGEDQAWMHSGRWEPAEAIAQKKRREIEGQFEAAAKRIEAEINRVTR